MIFLSFSTKHTSVSNDGAYAIKLSWTPNSSAESESCTAALDLENYVFIGNRGCALHFEILKGELHPESNKQMALFPELLKTHLAEHFSKSIEEVQFKEIVFLGNTEFHSATYTVIVDGKEKVFGISKN